MDLVTITIAGIVLLVLLYKNWIPALMAWVQDRVRS